MRCLFEKDDLGRMCYFFHYDFPNCRLNHGYAANYAGNKVSRDSWETWLPVDISVADDDNDYYHAMTDFNDVEYKGKMFSSSFNFN